jgi:hypothetical protein
MQYQETEHHQLINIYNEGPQIYGKAMRRMCDEREDAKCE